MPWPPAGVLAAQQQLQVLVVSARWLQRVVCFSKAEPPGAVRLIGTPATLLRRLPRAWAVLAALVALHRPACQADA